MSQPLEDVHAKEGSSVKLSCGFSPSPRVVRWFKGRTALKTSNKYSMSREGPRAELTVHGLAGADSGQYRCVAGGCQSSAHLQVEGRRGAACVGGWGWGGSVHLVTKISPIPASSQCEP